VPLVGAPHNLRVIYLLPDACRGRGIGAIQLHASDGVNPEVRLGGAIVFFLVQSGLTLGFHWREEGMLLRDRAHLSELPLLQERRKGFSYLGSLVEFLLLRKCAK